LGRGKYRGEQERAQGPEENPLAASSVVAVHRVTADRKARIRQIGVDLT
jgi:hypothetical protein